MISLGASNNIGIGVSINLRDNFSSRAKGVENSLASVHKNVNRVMRDNLRMVRDTSAAATAFGVAMLWGFKRATDVSMEFTYLMDAVGAVSKASVGELDLLSKKALSLAGTTIYTAREVAGAMKYMGMAGFSVKDIDDTIYAVTKLGEATGTGISGKNEIADYMTNMMTAFNMRAKDSMRMADILTTAVTKSNVDIHDIHEAIKYSGADLTTVGATFEEAAALVSVLGNAGLRGSIAGTSIGNMIQKLAKGVGEFRTSRQESIFAQWGLSSSDIMDTKGNMLSIVDIIENIKKQMATGNLEQLNQIEGFFGRRGARAFAAILRDPNIGSNLRDMHQLLITGSQDRTLDVAAERMNNLKGDTIIMASAWEAFQIAVGSTIEPLARVAVQGVTKILNVLTKIVSTPIGKWAVIGIASMTIIGTVAAGLMLTISSIGLLLTSTTVSFKTMKMAGVWAWNQMLAAALRYKAVASIIDAMHGRALVSKGSGTWRRASGTKGAGQFVAGTVAERYMRRFGNKSFMGFLTNIGKAVPRLATLTGVLGRVGGIFLGLGASVVGVIGSILGWSNLLKTGHYWLGTFVHGLAHAYDYLTTLFTTFSHEEASKYADERYAKRQAGFREYLGMEAVEKDMYRRASYDRTNDNRVYQGTELYKNRKAELDRAYQSMGGDARKETIQTNIYLDKQKIGEATHDVITQQDREEAARLLTY